MHHWKKALARSLGWVDHVKFEGPHPPVVEESGTGSAGSALDDEASPGSSSSSSSPASPVPHPDHFVTKLQNHLEGTASRSAAASATPATGAPQLSSVPFHPSPATDRLSPVGTSDATVGRLRAGTLVGSGVRRQSGQGGRSFASGMFLLGTGVALGMLISHYRGSSGSGVWNWGGVSGGGGSHK